MILQGNRSGHGERKQAWQALTGPFGSSQCLQSGERNHESGYRCESLNHLNTEIFKHLTPIQSLQLGYESGLTRSSWFGESLESRYETLNRLNTETVKHLNIQELKDSNT